MVVMYSPPSRKCKIRLKLPRTLNDTLGVLCVLFGGLLLIWYEVFHILPTYYPKINLDLAGQEKRWTELCILYAIAIYFAVNIYGNWFKVITTDTSREKFMFTSSSLLPDGWRYCSECDLNLPSRSHHCKVCDMCILKRDHHCWFTGCCIGYFNHRYYIAMITNMVGAALFCNIFNLTFVVSVKGHLTLYTFLSYIGPHVGWLLGYYDFYVFAITLQTTIGTVLLGLFSWLLYIQICQIITGQTKYEVKRRVKKYNLGVIHNLKEILGKRWYLVLLFPWIPSPLPGNGIYFKIKGE
ncbi:zinc finger protein [Mactra antiquata]